MLSFCLRMIDLNQVIHVTTTSNTFLSEWCKCFMDQSSDESYGDFIWEPETSSTFQLIVPGSFPVTEIVLLQVFRPSR